MKEKKSAGSSRPEKLVRKSAADIRRYVKSEKYKADSARLKAHIAKYGPNATEEDLQEIPELTEEELASMRPFHPKQSVTIRLDADVLAWLRSGGPRYQTRINEFLRAIMNRSRKRG